MNAAPADLTSPVELRLSLKTVSEMNQREHFRVKAARAKNARFMTAMAVRPFAFRLSGMFPLLVTFTRVAPGIGLDAHDNLPSSMKNVCDGLCDALGIRDRDPRISFRYAQRRGARGSYAVEIKLEVNHANT